MVIEVRDFLNKICKYFPKEESNLISKALYLAKKAHEGQYRYSGIPYISHPMEVSMILLNIEADYITIIVGLLHDTVEDTKVSLNNIERNFGVLIRDLVDGVTKIDKIKFASKNLHQAENFKKLLLALSQDIRVLIVKIADRLHNMRTIDCFYSDSKKFDIASETLNIYAPLAGRIGFHQIKLEMQDICFRILYPDIRLSIKRRVNNLYSDSNIKRIERELFKIISGYNIISEIYGREKSPYSIWMKMQSKNLRFDELSDIVAFRIIVESIEECYRVIYIIHSNYSVVPETFQDFLSVPKKNGYQSIHTVIIGPLNKKIEIQIRTKQMDEIAEFGLASHWSYKEKTTIQEKNLWVKELVDILDNSADSNGFLYNAKLAMHYEKIYCFSNNGKIVALPKNSTILDFAYSLDNKLGNNCVGAIVNNRSVSLNHVLHNGDQIQILASEKQKPCISWVKFIVTGTARSNLIKSVRSYNESEFIVLGKLIFDSLYQNKKDNKILIKLKKQFNKETIKDLFFAIGKGEIHRDSLIKYLFNRKLTNLLNIKFLNIKNIKPIEIDKLIPGIAIDYSECCHPIHGDQIIGFFDKKLQIHVSDCKKIKKFIISNHKNLIKTIWNHNNISNTAKIICNIKNEIGSIYNLTKSISNNYSNILNIIINNRTDEFFEILLYISVQNSNHLNIILTNLNLINSINYTKNLGFIKNQNSNLTKSI